MESDKSGFDGHSVDDFISAIEQDLPHEVEAAILLIIEQAKPILEKLKNQGNYKLIFSTLNNEPFISFRIDRNDKLWYTDEISARQGPIESIVNMNFERLVAFIDMLEYKRFRVYYE